MRLERVTSRSSEAGLAGWIASNDVTLFTMVLVMVIAIFLHTKLNREKKQHHDLAGQHTALLAKKASMASALDDLRGQFDQSNVQLRLTQEERDQLQTQLVEKLQSLAQLNAKLDSLLKEKGQLETQRGELLATQDAITRQKAAIQGDRDTLRNTNTTLSAQLTMLSAQLTEKVEALRKVDEQRQRLEKQANQLDNIVASLKQRLKEMDVQLVDAAEQADEMRAASESQVEKLKSQVADSDKRAEEYLAQMQRAAALLKDLTVEKEGLQVQLTKTEQQAQSQMLEEAENNRTLVGLKGRVQRVAIVLDASGSMRQAGAGGGDRWAEARDIVATWLSHLNVEHCVLIVYSIDVRTFPDDGKLADLRGPTGKTTRESLMTQLQAVAPGGWTDTYLALAKAYEYDVDTILLFSDGAPSKVATGAYDDNLARQIYQLCGEHAGIPVNTIGLGNYFDKDMSTFLRKVATITGGAFRGE